MIVNQRRHIQGHLGKCCDIFRMFDAADRKKIILQIALLLALDQKKTLLLELDQIKHLRVHDVYLYTVLITVPAPIYALPPKRHPHIFSVKLEVNFKLFHWFFLKKILKIILDL